MPSSRPPLVCMRIGDFTMTTFPSELNVQIALNLKKASPHSSTFVAGDTNGYVDYSPTAEQLRNVGGVQEDSDCLLAPESQAIFEAKTIEMPNQFCGGRNSATAGPGRKSRSCRLTQFTRHVRSTQATSASFSAVVCGCICSASRYRVRVLQTDIQIDPKTMLSPSGRSRGTGVRFSLATLCGRRHYMDSTSISLLRRLQADDNEAAWERFVELYAPLIFHWSLNHGLNATDAADLVQDVLTVLVVKLPEFQYDPGRRFRGWLRTVTLNKANDFHRRNSVRPDSDLGEAVSSVPATTTDVDLFDEAEYRGFLVERAMRLMQSAFRDDSWQACWKYVVEGMKAADVARELGITTNMVYLAKSRVLARLRQELDGILD